MRNVVLPRRLLVGGLASSLLLGGVAVLPLLGSASAAGPCPTYTDPAGDAAPGSAMLAPAVGEDDTDIVAVTHSVDAGVFSSVVKVTGLAQYGPDFAIGDEFDVRFTVAGKAVELFVARDESAGVLAGSPVPVNPFPVGAEVRTGATVNDAASTMPVKAIIDLKASTVTLSVTVADLEKAVGAPLTGKPFSAMSALAYYNPGFLNDTATAPATASYVFGGSCSGGAPAPAPSGSATPAPTPTGTPTPAPTSTATPPAATGALFDQPRKGCVSFTDAAGDADPTGSGELSEGSLDVTQVNLKSPAEGLQVYVKVANLAGALKPYFTGRSYTSTITVAGKTIAVTAGAEGPATATVGGTANTDLKATAKFDTKNNVVVFTLPQAGLDKVAGAPVAKGAAITATTVNTSGVNMVRAFPTDTATGTKPEEKTYAYGDNACFLPRPGLLTIEADPSGVFTDSTDLFVTLTDADETAVEGATLSVSVGAGKVVTGVSDADGVVELTVPITVPAGAQKVQASYAGTDVVGKVSATSDFKVLVEKALLTAKATVGTVTATVKDDDKAVVAGQFVTFTVGSKVTKVKTDAKGVAVLKGLAKGASVKVAFAAVSGRYTAAPTVTVKTP